MVVRLGWPGSYELFKVLGQAALRKIRYPSLLGMTDGSDGLVKVSGGLSGLIGKGSEAEFSMGSGAVVKMNESQ